MKFILRFFCVLSAWLFCFNYVQAAFASGGESKFQLIIELRDGSRVVGKTLDEALSFHSAALGEMKLSWAGIRSLEYTAGTDSARLTATNGDAFTVQLATDILTLETGFGKTDLPVKLIKGIKVTPSKLDVAAAPVPAGEAGSRLTIELRDGSHVVGKGLDDSLSFHSAAMGDLKLTWAGIRTISFAADSDTARMTATNGDVYEVQLAAPAVRVETSFGKSELPVKLIRSLKVSPMTGPGQLPSGLVALWSGEGDGSDSAGGNNATVPDGVTYAPAKVGQGFNLNGRNQRSDTSRIIVPDAPGLNFGADQDFSITAWIRPLSNPGNYTDLSGEVMTVISKRYSPDVYTALGYEMYLGEGRLCFQMIDSLKHGSNYYNLDAESDLRDGKFHHIAVTVQRNSTTGLQFYVDGQLIATFDPTAVSGNLSNTGPLRIGNHPTEGISAYYHGIIDEVGLYSRALSAEEIQAICTEQNNGEPLPPPAPRPSSRYRIGPPPRFQ